MIQRKTFLMNEEGGSPGGGSVVTPPSESPASKETAQPPAYVTIDQLKSFASELRNGLFADLRKAGALKQDKTTVTEPKPAESQSQPPVPATGAMMPADVQSMIRREQAVAGAEGRYGMSPAQVKFMRVALEAENPDNEREWIDSFVGAMGIVKPQPTAPQAPASPPPAAAPAAPSSHSLPTAEGVVDIFNMTPVQHQQVLGPKGIRNVLEQLWAIGNQASGAPQRPKPPTSR